MSQKTMIIIGAGIAGLSAGAYAQMNGFRTTIFEMHDIPGGLCTSWKRKGYLIDGCIHWLVGSSPQSNFYKIWEELGAVQGRQFLYAEQYGHLQDAQGNTLTLYTDLDRLERHMKEVAPEDHKLIDEFITAARRCTTFEPPIEKPAELWGFFGTLKFIVTQFPLLRMLWKWGRVSLEDFGKRFKSPLLREAFPLMFMPRFPVAFMLMSFAWMHKKAAGYPVGGSLAFAKAIEQRYVLLGGNMRYKSRVAKILVENGRAVGVKLVDGSEYRADYVISAADGHATIFEMLEGKFVDETIKGYYDTLVPFPPLLYVSLGINRRFDDVPRCLGGMSFQLQQPIMIGNVEQRFLNVHVYNFDETIAPKGKTVLVMMLRGDYSHWKELRENSARYKSEKEKIADTLVSLLDKRFPGLASQVEMRDVATPMTFERYTGNWKGSFEGWQVTPDTWSFGKLMKKTLPGLSNFYMAGHWVEPGGGIPPAAMSGRNIIQIICKKEKRKFTTTV